MRAVRDVSSLVKFLVQTTDVAVAAHDTIEASRHEGAPRVSDRVCVLLMLKADIAFGEVHALHSNGLRRQAELAGCLPG